jgi:hypothetical protein
MTPGTMARASRRPLGKQTISPTVIDSFSRSVGPPMLFDPAGQGS